MYPLDGNKSLRDRMGDPEQRRIANGIWEFSTKYHDRVRERQRADGHASSNGRDHCLRVESYIDYLISQSAIVPPVNGHELLLLSAAACCHDFGKALPAIELAAYGHHGEASAAMIPDSEVGQLLETSLSQTLQELVASHSVRAADLQTTFSRWGPDPVVANVTIRQALLELLLRVADFLDLTYARIDPDLLHERSPEGRDPVVHARLAMWGFRIDGQVLRLTGRAKSTAEEADVYTALTQQQRKDFDPLRCFLTPRGLPDAVLFEVRASATPPVAPALPPESVLGNVSLAARAMALAKTLPGGDQTTAEARVRPLPQAPAAYWFLSTISCPGWLPLLSAHLREIASGQDRLMLSALHRALRGMARKQPVAVLESGLVECLWGGQTEQHRYCAMDILQETGKWQSPTAHYILGSPPGRFAQHIEGAAYGLRQYAKDGPAEAGFALDWFLRWSAAAAPEDERTNVPDWTLLETVGAAPGAAIRRALPLVDLALAEEQSDYGVAMELRESTMPALATLLLVMRNLLASELRKPSTKGNDGVSRRAVKRLLRSSDRKHRIVGLSVCRKAKKHRPELNLEELAVEALANADTWVSAGSEVAEALLAQAFGDMAPGARKQVEDVLLDIPCDERDEAWRGALRYRALRFIPDEHVSNRVAAEIERLRDANPRLRAQDSARDTAPTIERVQYGWDDAAAPIIEEAVLDPSRLRDAVAQYMEADSSPGTRPAYLHYTLHQALQKHPEQLMAVLQAIRPGDRTFYDLVVPGVIEYLQITDEPVGPESNIIDVVRALPEYPGTRACDGLAYLLERHWTTIDKSCQGEVIEALARWAANEEHPTADGTARPLRVGPSSDLVDAGLNSARGMIAHALLFVASQVDDAQPALEAVRALAEDPAAEVRAVVLQHLHWIFRRHYEEAAKMAMASLQGAGADLFQAALSTLGALRPPHVAEFGFGLVRDFMDDEDDDTQKAAGALASEWPVRLEDEDAARLLREVLRDGGAKAREAAGDNLATRMFGQNDAEVGRARRLYGQVLGGADSAFRTGAMEACSRVEWGEVGDQDIYAVADMIGRAAQSTEKEVLARAATLLWRLQDEPKCAPIIAAVIRRILDTPLAVGEFLREPLHLSPAKFETVYERLSDANEAELAMRLLDAAALHCVEAARPLIEAYAKGLQEGETGKGDADAPTPLPPSPTPPAA